MEENENEEKSFGRQVGEEVVRAVVVSAASVVGFIGTTLIVGKILSVKKAWDHRHDVPEVEDPTAV